MSSSRPSILFFSSVVFFLLLDVGSAVPAVGKERQRRDVSDELPCPELCPMHWMPVCGSDGSTYSNRCALDVAICLAKKKGEQLAFVADGLCTRKKRESETIPCPQFCTMQWMPVCGSDGRTYGNRCVLDGAICEAEKKGEQLAFVVDGPCARKKRESETIPCPLACPYNWMPVCGSDGQTYGNRCALDVAICEAEKKGEQLAFLADGPCARK